VLELDSIDLHLLSELQMDARLTLSVLAERVGVSISACHRRIRNLERQGAIEGYGAHLSAYKLGYQIVAFVRIELSHTTQEARAAFEHAVQAMDLVIECHLLAGRGSYLLRVLAHDLMEYEAVVAPRLATLPFATDITAEFSGKEVKNRTRWTFEQ
jgi:DNA-binding Lrp family transcriptional regulator